jgi:peptidoglycan hydrolase-like protein with peptidoglycan-binding domain
MPLPLIPILGAAGLGLLAYKAYDDAHPELQSLSHTDPTTGQKTQVVVPVKSDKPQLSVTSVPIAGVNAHVIASSGTGARYVPPVAVKRSQVPGRLDLLPTVITPTGASSLAVMTLADAQNALNTLGYGPLQVDGKLGQATQAAVRNYQSKKGLVPVDGSPGPNTKAAMQADLANLAGVGAAIGAHPAVVNATRATPAQVAAQVTGNLVGDMVAQNRDLAKAVAVADQANTVAKDAAKIFSLFNFGAVDADPSYDPMNVTIGPDQGFLLDKPNYSGAHTTAPKSRQAKTISTMTQAEGAAQAKRFHVETLSDVQTALNRLGASPELDVTGALDARTVAATKVFQVTHGLLADGVPGPKTRTALTLAILASGQRSDFGLTLFTLFGAEPPPVGSKFGAAIRAPAPVRRAPAAPPPRSVALPSFVTRHFPGVSAPSIASPGIAAPGGIAAPSVGSRPFIAPPGAAGFIAPPGAAGFIAPPGAAGFIAPPGLGGLLRPPPPGIGPDGLPLHHHRHHHDKDDQNQPQPPPPPDASGGGAPAAPSGGGGGDSGGGGGDSGGGVSQAPDPSSGFDDGGGSGGSFDDGSGSAPDDGGSDSGGGVSDVSSIMSGFGSFG